MSEIASRQQLRMAYLRWAIVTVPALLFLGFLSGGSVAAGRDNAWYVALDKPPLTPPDWVFPVAWTLLYIMIGLALAMILHARGARGRGVAIGLFVLQFAINLTWNPLFFGSHRVLLALGVIVVMFVVGLATTIAFARIRQAAGWLMVPYLAWICFAGALTWGIHDRNPQADTLVPSSATTQIAL